MARRRDEGRGAAEPAFVTRTARTERGWARGNVLPDKITLFQGPIEESATDREDVVIAITETLIHEIGHYFGLSEEEIEEIEEHYWAQGDEEGPGSEEAQDPDIGPDAEPEDDR